ncbi:hypothetical protein H9P43_005435 [Blastocladiella emersonii ATCC 22665]|nr:hypothetical protein H9P43_005435 [Blastocladiella emersonii ATCC 22665]
MSYAAADSAKAAKLASTIVVTPLNVCFGAFNDVLLEASDALLGFVDSVGKNVSSPVLHINPKDVPKVASRA